MLGRFHEDYGDLKKNTIRDDIEEPISRPRKFNSPDEKKKGEGKNLLITHKRRQRGGGGRIKSPKKNPYAKYLVENQSLVYLQWMTEEANERARLAQEALLGERAIKLYDGWWETPYQNIIENEQKIIESLRQEREQTRLQKELIERQKVEDYKFVIQTVERQKQKAVQNTVAVKEYLDNKDSSSYNFEDDRRYLQPTFPEKKPVYLLRVKPRKVPFEKYIPEYIRAKE